MKILTVILTFLCFQPFAVQAETALDMSKSFQVAAARKLVQNDGSDLFSKQGKFLGLTAKTAGDAVCTQVQYKNSSGQCNGCTGSQCKNCPDNATCNGGNSFTCNDGFYKKGHKCNSIESGTTCKSGYAKLTQFYESAPALIGHCYVPYGS